MALSHLQWGAALEREQRVTAMGVESANMTREGLDREARLREELRRERAKPSPYAVLKRMQESAVGPWPPRPVIQRRGRGQKAIVLVSAAELLPGCPRSSVRMPELLRICTACTESALIACGMPPEAASLFFAFFDRYMSVTWVYRGARSSA